MSWVVWKDGGGEGDGAQDAARRGDMVDVDISKEGISERERKRVYMVGDTIL